ncbi:MAG: MotA/TolQ/ExbB proton channel family protein [Bryobacterales bacterium]|nr:MotA/TolQ/ExbB proton channel family protein [Bryobacterales bacterium]
MDTAVLRLTRDRDPHLRILSACRRAAENDSRVLETLPVIANAAFVLSAALFLFSLPDYYPDIWALLAFVFWGKYTAAVITGLVVGTTIHTAQRALAGRQQALRKQSESFADRLAAALAPEVEPPEYTGAPVPVNIQQLILNACRRVAATESRHLRRRLNSLATVASAAPLFGFLGTALGILNSFRGIVGEKSTIMAAIAYYLSEALLPTAWSLALAILARSAYHALQKQHRALELQMESCALCLANSKTRTATSTQAETAVDPAPLH